MKFKKNTLICEYAGEVVKENSVKKSKSNFIFSLENRNEMHDDRLCIKPLHYANIGAFISGVNQFKQGFQNEINCESDIFNIRNELHVIIFSSKEIKQGDELKYDYYPREEKPSKKTKNFI